MTHNTLICSHHIGFIRLSFIYSEMHLLCRLLRDSLVFVLESVKGLITISIKTQALIKNSHSMLFLIS